MWILILLAASLVTTAGALARSLDGPWQSQGYGYVVEVRGPDLKEFEVTSTTCVLGFTARLHPTTIAGDPGTAAVFVSDEGRRFSVRPGDSTDDKLLHFDNSATDIRIHRMKRLPTVCERLTGNS